MKKYAEEWTCQGERLKNSQDGATDATLVDMKAKELQEDYEVRFVTLVNHWTFRK